LILPGKNTFFFFPPSSSERIHIWSTVQQYADDQHSLNIKFPLGANAMPSTELPYN
jgi:hypothetical protein